MTTRLNLPITLLFCLLYNLLGAQEWVHQHPNQDVKQMNDIFVGTDNYGYAAGMEWFSKLQMAQPKLGVSNRNPIFKLWWWTDRKE